MSELKLEAMTTTVEDNKKPEKKPVRGRMRSARVKKEPTEATLPLGDFSYAHAEENRSNPRLDGEACERAESKHPLSSDFEVDEVTFSQDIMDSSDLELKDAKSGKIKSGSDYKSYPEKAFDRYEKKERIKENGGRRKNYQEKGKSDSDEKKEFIENKREGDYPHEGERKDFNASLDSKREGGYHSQGAGYGHSHKNNKKKKQKSPKPQHSGGGQPNPVNQQNSGKRRMGKSLIQGNYQSIVGRVASFDFLRTQDAICEFADTVLDEAKEVFEFEAIYNLSLSDLCEKAKKKGIFAESVVPKKKQILLDFLNAAFAEKRPILVRGVLDTFEKGGGIIVYEIDSYRIKELSTYIPEVFIEQYALKRGHILEVYAHPPKDNEFCPFALKVKSVMGEDPGFIAQKTPFIDLVPYYPTERILLEADDKALWDNTSMRIVDLLTPIGLGQRGLIVAPPRTGKTVLLQAIANTIRRSKPHVHLIILMIDERPEEVTDFRRQVDAEIISSTFDESAESHVHAAEMVISKARRMVEHGHHVMILLDSITRLARAYNTLMPNSGKILSGGVEANALQKPKRFFGSARNIEGGGSLTILGSALVETGSRMDEVIFEEFKGTGNMELHLDRALSEKRIFPALSFDKSGTRKEELLYHPDEMQKIYALRRAMKGVPSDEAMSMLIQRVKKTKSNAEFLMGLNR